MKLQKIAALLLFSATSTLVNAAEVMINNFDGTIASPTDQVAYHDNEGAVHDLTAADADFTLASGQVWDISWNASSATNYQKVSFSGVGGSTLDLSEYSELRLDVINNFGSNVDFGIRIEDQSAVTCDLEQYGFADALVTTLSKPLAECTGLDLANVSYISVFAMPWTSLVGSIQIDSVRGVTSDNSVAPEPETELRTEAGSLGGLVIIMLSTLLWMRRRIS